MKIAKRHRTALVVTSTILVIGGFFYMYPRAEIVRAAAQDIVITEFMYDPQGGDVNHEWIELYNAGTESVTIEGGGGAGDWRLFDGANHVFSTSTILQPRAYMIIAQDTLQFFKDYPGFQGIFAESNMSLDNDGGQIALRVGASGALWSQIQYAHAWGAAGNGYALAKRNVLGSNAADEWTQSATIGGTPGASNTLVQNTPASSVATSTEPFAQDSNDGSAVSDGTTGGMLAYTDQNGDSTRISTNTLLYINEIYPSPRTGEKEWIELYNPNNIAIDLKGWRLTDNSSTTTLYGTINPTRFVYWEFKNVLNNEGDILTLYRPDGTRADQIIYGDWHGSVLPAPEDGQSIARFPDGSSTGSQLRDFFLTTTPTRAGSNSISVPPLPALSDKNTSGDTRALSSVGVLFSELLPNPVGPDDQMRGEFIELMNNATTTADISGWRLESGGQSHRIASGTIIGAGQFALFYRDNTHIFLSNTDTSVSMFDARGALIDRMKYENAEAGVSLNRAGLAELEKSTVATPGVVNKIIQPNHPPEPVMSVEGDLFPGNRLWFDASDSWDADGDELSFIWIFSDGVRTQGKWVTRTFGDTKTYKATLVAIDSHRNARSVTHQFKINEIYDFNLPQQSIVGLQMDATSTIADDIGQGSADVSFAKSIFQERERAVRASSAGALKVTTIGGAFALPTGAQVSLEGVAVAAPGEFNAQTMYIASVDDAGSAIQVYMQKKQWPRIKRGDIVRVEGELGKAYGAFRIKIKQESDIEVAARDMNIAPLEVSASDVPLVSGAVFVRTEGTIVDDVSGGFALSDSSGQIFLGLKRGNALPKGLVHLGDIARVTGIAVPYKDGMQILPRDAYDIEITGRDSLAGADSKRPMADSGMWFALITIGGVLGVGAVWLYRRRGGRDIHI